jgi:hypothetical protein
LANAWYWGSSIDALPKVMIIIFQSAGAQLKAWRSLFESIMKSSGLSACADGVRITGLQDSLPLLGLLLNPKG